MADQKVTALNENTTVATTDMLYLVDDPGGTPASEKATVANVVAAGMVDIGARVYNSGDISINDSAFTALTFDSERYDTDTIHSTVANTGRLTATTAGKYLIVGNVRFANNGTGTRIIDIYLNGTTIIANIRQDATSAAADYMIVTTIYELSATDYVELRVYQSSGGALDIENFGNYSPEFMMQKIG